MNCARLRLAGRTYVFALMLMTLFSGACDTFAQDVPTASQSPLSRGFGMVPYRPSISRTATPTCKSPKLSYFDGPIVSNVQVVPVMWGSNVNAQTIANISQFYADATVSTWYDFLDEYAVAGVVGGTNQSIGRGTSTAATAITPSICAGTSHCNMTDAQLQTELSSQISAGKLPVPQLDATGNTNTAYMVHFPPNVTLNLDGASSCVQFCAYHNTSLFGSNNIPLLYGAIMDTFSGGCSDGCGTSTNPFDNESNIASHELSELVTDADIGLDTQNNYANPAAWGDNNNGCGEIADICDDGSGATITVSGRSWVVQELWSNKQSKCVSTGTPPSYVVSAPSTTPAAAAFAFSVTANNPFGSTVDSAYVGTVHFTSSDPSAVLPDDFTFVPEDQGTANFMATLTTLNSQTITATDALNGNIVGTSAAIDVSQAADLTTLSTACPTTFVENQSIALAATVNSGSNPTGTMDFEDDPTIFCGGVTLTSGSASCQTPVLMVQGGGTSSEYDVTANYSGDESNTASSSAPLALIVLSAGDVLFRGTFEAVIVGCPAY